MVCGILYTTGFCTFIWKFAWSDTNASGEFKISLLLLKLQGVKNKNNEKWRIVKAVRRRREPECTEFYRPGLPWHLAQKVLQWKYQGHHKLGTATANTTRHQGHHISHIWLFFPVWAVRKLQRVIWPNKRRQQSETLLTQTCVAKNPDHYKQWIRVIICGDKKEEVWC